MKDTEDSFCSKKPGFALAYILQGCPVSDFRIKVANFPMLRAIFISYINAFSQSDVVAFAHLCPLPSKLCGLDLVICLFPSSSCHPLTCSADTPAFLWSTRRLNTPPEASRMQRTLTALWAEFYSATLWYPVWQRYSEDWKMLFELWSLGWDQDR